MKARKPIKRGAVRTNDSVFVGAWLPLPLIALLDNAVLEWDSDRSKIIRDALRDKVAKEAGPMEAGR